MTVESDSDSLLVIGVLVIGDWFLVFGYLWGDSRIKFDYDGGGVKWLGLNGIPSGEMLYLKRSMSQNNCPKWLKLIDNEQWTMKS